jgi:hypothetical protein
MRLPRPDKSGLAMTVRWANRYFCPMTIFWRDSYFWVIVRPAEMR